jgi:hypothetical protein
MKTLTQNPNPVTQEQEASLVAFIEQDLDLRASDLSRHHLAWLAVRALNRRGWLAAPEQEITPFVFTLETGSGVRI